MGWEGMTKDCCVTASKTEEQTVLAKQKKQEYSSEDQAGEVEVKLAGLYML